MELDVSVIVSTFGDNTWKALAEKRAIPSAEALGVPVIYTHLPNATGPHEPRNAGLAKAETEFVCHLDADDELTEGFFEHMETVDGDLRPPSIHHVYQRITFMPKVVGHNHVCVADCLEFGNWLIVGTVARTELLKKVGGWKEWGTFEDFDLWQRCWIAGATITAVPRAIYKAYTTPQGRCRVLPVKESTAIQRAICETNLPHKDWSWMK